MAFPIVELAIGLQYIAMGFVAVWLIYRSKLKIANLAVFFGRGTSSAGVSTVIDDVVVYGTYTVEGDESKPEKFVVSRDVSPIGVLGSGNSFVWLGEREFKRDRQAVSFQGRPVPVDMKFPAERKYGYTIYKFVVDGDKATQITYGGQALPVDIEFARRHTRNGVLAMILNAAKGMPMATILLFVVVIILAAVCAGVGGYLAGSSGNHTIYTP